jgi:predicted RNA polymerase sigma factor
MAVGTREALTELARCATDPALVGNHRIPAIRAHLLEREGKVTSARADYLEAARLTSSDPERRYLLQRAARVSPNGSMSVQPGY